MTAARTSTNAAPRRSDLPCNLAIRTTCTATLVQTPRHHADDVSPPLTGAHAQYYRTAVVRWNRGALDGQVRGGRSGGYHPYACWHVSLVVQGCPARAASRTCVADFGMKTCLGRPDSYPSMDEWLRRPGQGIWCKAVGFDHGIESGAVTIAVMPVYPRGAVGC